MQYLSLDKGILLYFFERVLGPDPKKREDVWLFLTQLAQDNTKLSIPIHDNIANLDIYGILKDKEVVVPMQSGIQNVFHNPQYRQCTIS